MSKETIQQLVERHIIDNNGQWNHEKDEAWILAGQGQFKITREEFNAAADRMRGKPDWSLAPEWGRYLSQDGNGSWWFYDVAVKPGKESFSCPIGGRSQKAGIGRTLGDWRNTLEKRPEQLALTKVDIDGKGNLIGTFEFNGEAPAKTWFEAGELPPVGTICEVYNHEFGKDAAWEKCTILFMGKFKCVYSSESCLERVGNVDLTGAIEFRRIKTDKEKAIEAADAVIRKTSSAVDDVVLNALYDAGLLRLPDQK